MGVDADIYFRCEDEYADTQGPLPSGFIETRLGEYRPEYVPAEATHEVETSVRYYGPEYGVGPWPDLCAVLMQLLAAPNVSKVWYGGLDGSVGIKECSADDVLMISKGFMERKWR